VNRSVTFFLLQLTLATNGLFGVYQTCPCLNERSKKAREEGKESGG